MRASFFAASEDALFLLDTRGRLRMVNPAFARLFDRAADSLRGLSCRSRHKPTLDDPPDDHLAALLHAPPEVLQGEPQTVRRVLSRPEPARIYDVAFFPLARDSGVQILGRLRPVAVPSATGPPLPEALLALRQRHLTRWTWDLLGDPSGRLAVQARLAARTRASVLLVGPPGSGKTTVARVIHAHSAERERPLAALDLRRRTATRTQEMLTQTRGSGAPGAVLLRGLDGCPAALIDFLADWLRPEWEGHPPNPERPRLYAALCDRGRLPAALAPLGALEVTVPPLRERGHEWEGLLQGLREILNLLPGPALHTLTPAAREALRSHTWPGNLGELHAVLLDARAGCRTGVLDRSELPAWLRVPPRPTAPPPVLNLETTLQEAERRLIQLALHRARGNRSRAAELLGLTRARLLRRLDQLGLGESEAEG
jgi:hypothetical protein